MSAYIPSRGHRPSLDEKGKILAFHGVSSDENYQVLQIPMHEDLSNGVIRS